MRTNFKCVIEIVAKSLLASIHDRPFIMAQVAPPLTYLYHIPSVHESNGGVPAILETLDLNRSAQAGAPIDPQNLSHAKTVAKALKTVHDLSIGDRVTGAVVESAVEAARFTEYQQPTQSDGSSNR
ncbi:uncharacterized protein LACBIDRAFT_315988 [Laccaria bicolor S238N-H82]|uniref:Predicted protein n=1 Tax=Laccaria bicolor (strain S238N-H82 / ATCC MYA-4686) TaxID=486041 RepID=B0D3N1_LACBS|nr:uncharacterized protein LACBIDRAFT_315988 [Laccaria bicolor S238N-H82]EDR11301.1 predicted protein [Laccaria bicolor S238N-H82]|eukprot:XP_001878602.1 predicted protein [Laccaria bicolor S238N-H82]